MRRISCITGVIIPALLAMMGGCADPSVCHTNQLNCGGACIAPASDDANCGACGHACDTGMMCTGGACEPIPPSNTCLLPMLMCGSDCIDPQTTAAHCGSCDVACDASADCIGGTCDGPLAVVQTGLVSKGILPRDAFVVQDGRLTLTKLDPAGFQIVDHTILPDGRIVLVATGADSVTELYVVSSRGGALTKLNPALVAGGNVLAGVAVSRDGTKLLYRADQDTAGVVELYAVALASPGTSVKVNGTLVSGGSVSRVFALSGDGHRAAYLAEQDSANLEQAYTVDLSAGTPGASVLLAGTALNGVFDLAMTDDGTKIVYLAHGGVAGGENLVEVDTATPDVANEVDDGGGEGFFITQLQIAADGHVIYTGAISADAQQLRRLSLTAPFTPEVIVSNTNGFVREFLVTPDGGHVLYRDQAEHLFVIDVTTPDAPVLVSLATSTSEDTVTDFALAANNKTLVFRAGADGAEGGLFDDDEVDSPPQVAGPAPSLYAIDLTATTPTPVKISPDLVDGHAGVFNGYAITPDGRVLFRADERVSNLVEAYVGSIETAGAPVRIDVELDSLTDSNEVSRLSAFP